MTKRRKVLWLSHEGNFSGANVAMLEFILKLQQQFDFTVVVPASGTYKIELEKLAIKCLVVKNYNWAGVKEGYSFLQKMQVLLRTLFATYSMCLIIWRLKISRVFTNTELPVIGAISAKITGRKHVWWIHEFGREHFGYVIGWGSAQRAYRVMNITTDLMVCMSDALVRKYSALVSVHVVRIYQPVSWTNSGEQNFGTRGKYLVFGQLSRGKGHLDVLRVLHTFIKTGGDPSKKILSIIGPCDDTVYYKEVMDFIGQNSLESFVQVEVGYFSKQTVIPFYEVLLLASSWEAFGRVIVEANKAGLKVIVKNSGGSPELVNESNGLIYNTGEDLLKIFQGKIPMPQLPITLSYNEDSELDHLQNLLDTL